METSPRRAFFLPRRSPPRQGEGRAAGEKECQDRGSKEARARRLIASADGPRFGEKNDKMPEWGLTRNLIEGGKVLDTSPFDGKEYAMCMIFKNVREPLKQIAIWSGVVGLLPLTAWYGTAAYSPPPESEEYNKSTTRYEEKIKDAEGPAEKKNSETSGTKPRQSTKRECTFSTEICSGWRIPSD